MALPIIGPLISGAAGLVGSILGNRSRERSSSEANERTSEDFRAGLEHQTSERQGAQWWTDKQRRKAQRFANRQRQQGEEFNASEAQKSRRFLRNQADADRALAERFAKKSAGWQFNDLMEEADAAGIHRLAALGGASGTTYTPAGGGTAQASSPGGSGPAFSGSAGGGGGVSTPQYIPEIGGSIIGDGMNALSDMVVGTWEAAAQNEIDQKNAAMKNLEHLARLDLMKSEADLYKARSRTELSRAMNPGGSHFGDPNNYREHRKIVIEPHKTSDGSVVYVPVGPDLSEIASGTAIEAYGNIKGRVKKGKEWLKKPRYSGESFILSP